MEFVKRGRVVEFAKRGGGGGIWNLRKEGGMTRTGHVVLFIMVFLALFLFIILLPPRQEILTFAGESTSSTMWGPVQQSPNFPYFGSAKTYTDSPGENS